MTTRHQLPDRDPNLILPASGRKARAAAPAAPGASPFSLAPVPVLESAGGPAAR